VVGKQKIIPTLVAERVSMCVVDKDLLITTNYTDSVVLFRSVVFFVSDHLPSCLLLVDDVEKLLL
jgi:ABC-type hemin transport system ATPase subunit